MTEKTILTQRSVAAAAARDAIYYVADTKVPGLLLCIQPTGHKTFQLYRKFKGRPKRITLGKVADLTVTEARELAQEAVGKMLRGIDPVQEKRAEKNRGVTLADAAAAYLAARRLAVNTVGGYKVVLEKYLADWQNRPLTTITREECAKRHKVITEQSPAQANRTMRFLRAVFNFAKEEYLDEHGKPITPDNPVAAIGHRRLWNREPQRTDCIRPHELAAWWRATADEIPAYRDYLRLVLLTGLRRREAAGLRWEDIDFAGRTLTAHLTKNGKNHVLPLSDYLVNLLTRRKAESSTAFVFPGPGRSGHLEEVKQAVARVQARSGVAVTVHGLRRSFASIAESLDIPAYSLKRMLNHASSGDVTANHYLVIDVERLRGHVQRITDFVLRAVGEAESATVIPLKEVSKAS